MKGKLTYKLLTLLLGIAVAVIIMITLWVRPFSNESGEVSEKPVHRVLVPAAKIVAERTLVRVIEILR
ncbi:MAG TPA: hypothetical protein VFM90_01410 [Cyclobacteriaceae bacterium]|nr:hypothetical protein [Cyclobacteriaceae bacterium]